MSKKKFSDSIKGKGYYIALVLCAVAIGISGYLYYRHQDDGQNKLAKQTAVDVTQEQNVPASANKNNNDDAAASQNAEQIQKPAQTASPLTGETVAKYSMEALSYNATTRDWRVHNGIDIAAEAGTNVCAAADGTVTTVYEDQTMGMTVVISHDGGYTTSYASLAQEVSVVPGQKVSMGDTIGTVGNTALLETAIGDHLHFAVQCNGEVVDPTTFFE